MRSSLVIINSFDGQKEDIEELAEFFLQKHSSQNSLLTLSNEALEIIEDYDWPGNIRELENVIQRCIVLSKGSIIEASDLPPEIIEQNESEPRIKTGKTLLDAETDFRRMYIIKTLRLAKTKSEAAELLGINRTHFYKMLSQLGIKYQFNKKICIIVSKYIVWQCFKREGNHKKQVKNMCC